MLIFSATSVLYNYVPTDRTILDSVISSVYFSIQVYVSDPCSLEGQLERGTQSVRSTVCRYRIHLQEHGSLVALENSFHELLSDKWMQHGFLVTN